MSFPVDGHSDYAEGKDPEDQKGYQVDNHIHLHQRVMVRHIGQLKEFPTVQEGRVQLYGHGKHMIADAVHIGHHIGGRCENLKKTNLLPNVAHILLQYNYVAETHGKMVNENLPLFHNSVMHNDVQRVIEEVT